MVKHLELLSVFFLFGCFPFFPLFTFVCHLLFDFGHFVSFCFPVFPNHKNGIIRTSMAPSLSTPEKANFEPRKASASKCGWVTAGISVTYFDLYHR